MAASSVPLILNRYRLLETRGSGGFGTVDVAWDNRLQRRVAIKRIPLTDNSNVLPGINEARTAALLNESHIVSVLDFEVTSTEALLIMEYVDGPTLSDLLEESRELLDLDTVAAIISDVAAALEYAHENQVLHLDIKPDNILIDHKGNIKVTDFGLAELSGSVGFSEPQGGTIGHMPPEQILQTHIDDRTDLWALAVLLYLLLTGSSPFHAASSRESLRLIMEEPFLLPSSVNVALNPEADEIIVRAMLADIVERYGSVQEFLEAIMPYLGSSKKGHQHLKVLVNKRDLDEVEYSDEWHEEEELLTDDVSDSSDPLAASHIWQRLPLRARGFFVRLIAAVACGCFALLGSSGLAPLFAAVPNLSILQLEVSPIAAIVVVLVAIAAFIAPRLGSALAVAVLVVGTFVRGLFFLGAALAILLALWWIFVGRKSAKESILVMLTPLMGFISLSFALPLLSAFLLPWRRALITMVVQGALLVSIAAVTTATGLARTGLVLPTVGSTNLTEQMYAFMADPAVWICSLSLLLAGLVMALLCSVGLGKGVGNADAVEEDEASGIEGLAVHGVSRSRTILGLVLAEAIILISFIIIPMGLGIEILQTVLLEMILGITLSFILLVTMLMLGVKDSQPSLEEV